jgi:membrane protein DedA with SNARE-associated domain
VAPHYGGDLHAAAALTRIFLSVEVGHLIKEYGYVIVALLVAAENLGLPLPGESALITAAAFAAHGHLWLPGVIIASTAGTIVGGSGGYWIGRAGGLRLVHRIGKFIRVGDADIQKGHEFFEKHGAKTVFLARFVAILRIVVGLLAGVSEMPFLRFTLYNALGGACWSVAIGLLAYTFGANLPRLHRLLGTGGLITAAVVLLAILVAFRLSRRRPAPST